MTNRVTRAGIYIHIPFCKSRCSYCDFATGLYETEIAARYVHALVAEISATRYSAQTVDTIYFGGGTPSMLSPVQIERILTTVKECFDVSSAAELTMEINPGSVTKSKLIEFKNAGVNRASFGAQTFDDKELAKLGRSHSTAET